MVRTRNGVDMVQKSNVPNSAEFDKPPRAGASSVAGVPEWETTLAQAEVAGLMPEPTALVTAGLLLAWRPRAPGVLLAIPPAWLLVAAATLWTMAGQ